MTISDLTSYRLMGATVGIYSGMLHSEILPPQKKSNTKERVPRTVPKQTLTDKVPSIVFQTWKTRDGLPRNYEYWRSSFFAMNPKHEILIWDDDDNRDFIASEFPWFLPTYDAYPQEIYRADIVRPFFLYRYGGIYADMDTECVQPLDALGNMGDVIIGRMGLDKSYPHSIPNAIMASRPGQLFWLFMIALAIERFPTCIGMQVAPENLTGPVLLRDTFLEYSSLSEREINNRISVATQGCADRLPSKHGQVVTLPPSLFYPIDWHNPIHARFRRKMIRNEFILPRNVLRYLFPNALMVTYWTHSW